MRTTITLILSIFIFNFIFAQTSEKMSYQAVVRNSANSLVVNTQVGMQISILQGSANGTVVYAEIHTPTTNANGLISVEIGGGTIVSGNYSTINWAAGPYFLKTETDPTGGTNYTITGTSQLLSVPYALHAKTAENITGTITETDPVYTSSPAHGITNTNVTDWNTAYGWGNHATAGYLTSYTETDPIFAASPAHGITNTNTSNWNTAYSWGNHATAGYLTSYTETDPVFAASPAHGITNTNTTNWNTAYGWGNHATAGYLTSFTESDPIFTAAPANAITNTNITNWNAAYSWGNHATAGYLTSFTETDPVFAASPAHNITNTNTTNWNTAYSWGNHATAGYLTSFTEQDPKVGSNTTNYLSKWNGTALVSSGIFDNGTNVGIGTSSPGAKLEVNGQIKITGGSPGAGKVLTSDASGLASWQTVSGGTSTRAVTSTSNYTIQVGDNVLIANTSSVITYTLPSAAVAGSGAVLYFYGLLNSFNITTSQTIYDSNGTAQTTLSGKYVAVLVSDGVNKWFQIH